MARERLQEVRARHAALVHGDLVDLLLDRAHFVDLAAQRVRQPLDHLGREAQAHQLVEDLLLRLQVAGRLVAFLLERDAHLLEQLRDAVELVERADLQFVELRGRHARRADVGRLFAFLVLVVAAGGREVLRGRVHQAVDHLVDRDLARADALAVRQDLGDRGRAGRNRHHHVLQAVFDALRDLDLALARQQFDRTHLAHVHAHRVGRATELGVHGRQRRLGLFLDVVVVGRGRDVLVHQQRLGVRGLVEDLDAHVAERADDRVDRLGVDQVVGQVIVDLGVRQEAALLAELDQRLQLVAAGLEVFLGAVVAALECFLQGLFLGPAILGAQLRRAHLLDDLHARVGGIVTGLRHGGIAAQQLLFGLLRLAARTAARRGRQQEEQRPSGGSPSPPPERPCRCP